MGVPSIRSHDPLFSNAGPRLPLVTCPHAQSPSTSCSHVRPNITHNIITFYSSDQVEDRRLVGKLLFYSIEHLLKGVSSQPKFLVSQFQPGQAPEPRLQILVLHWLIVQRDSAVQRQNVLKSSRDFSKKPHEVETSKTTTSSGVIQGPTL